MIAFFLNPANWPGLCYIAGSTLFIVGTVVGMLLAK